jgi:hypothetical protein
MNGTTIDPFLSPEIVGLTLSIFILIGLWLQLASFPRESSRMLLSWKNPRQMLTRNATESPRTIGVWISHGLATLGIWLFLILIDWTPLAIGQLGSAVAWMVVTQLIKRLGSAWCLANADLGSTMVEMHRHGLSLLATMLAVWGLVCSLQPYLQGTSIQMSVSFWLVAGSLLWASVQVTKLFLSLPKREVLGILYLCTLEWGWPLASIAWALSSTTRGH